MYPDLRQYEVIAYDTETTGLVHPIDKAFSFAIAAGDQAWYYDLRQEPKARDWLHDQLESFTGLVVCHNAAFDFCMSANAGIHLPINQLDDTAIRACLINEHEATRGLPFPFKKAGGYNLDALAKRYLERGKLEVDIGNIAALPVETAANYAKEDATLTLLLWEFQQQRIQALGLEQIAEFERGVMPSIISAQQSGVRVDVDEASRAMDSMTPLINQMQLELNKLAGWDVNVNSGPQMIKLFEPEEAVNGWYVGNVKIGTTGAGGPSLKAEYLRNITQSGDPRAKLVQEIRSALKTRDTFLAKHIREHNVQGRVFPDINQVANDKGGTKTGRLSYVNPALQQIPSRDKQVAEIVKKCFIPEDGHSWLSFDLASFEVRVFAALVGRYNDDIIKQYQAKNDLDFHQYVADLTGLPRNASYNGQANAKQLNLSMIFCQGKGATADKMGYATTDDYFEDEFGVGIHFKRCGSDAESVIAKYHQAVPGVKHLGDLCRNTVIDRSHGHNGEPWGYLKTAFGRRLRFPRNYKSYKASGLLIQATAADLNKENWKLSYEAMQGTDANLILNTHDSYDFSVPTDELEYWRDTIPNILERDFQQIPLVLDLNGYGSNWWEAVKE